jgi:hypothetical protein
MPRIAVKEAGNFIPRRRGREVDNPVPKPLARQLLNGKGHARAPRKARPIPESNGVQNYRRDRNDCVYILPDVFCHRRPEIES